MLARTLIDAEFPDWYKAAMDMDDATLDHGALFFNTHPKGSDEYGIFHGHGVFIPIDDLYNACQAYIDRITPTRKLYYARMYNISLADVEKAPTLLPEDPVEAVDGAVAVYKEVVVRRLANHPRAKYELLSRRKVPDLDDSQLHAIESTFPGMAPDDVVLWRRHLKDPGQLVYAGVAFFGERDTLSNSPNWEPKVKQNVKRLTSKRPAESPADGEEDEE